jgi:hypothetical protein
MNISIAHTKLKLNILSDRIILFQQSWVYNDKIEYIFKFILTQNSLELYAETVIDCFSCRGLLDLTN